MKLARKLVRPFLALLVFVALAVLVPLRKVASDEMSWTIQRGEWVWVVPDRVRKGDVVALADPLDPSRTVLRRAVGMAGQKIRYEEGSIRVNGKRIRQTDMGRRKDTMILKEVIWSSPPARPNPHLVAHSVRPTHWVLADKVEVPEGHWFLFADNRDGALDSRWWGPIAEEEIKGVVRFRVGQEDEHRPRFQLMLPEE